MGLLARLFGDVGVVYFEGYFEDGNKFEGSAPIESFNNDRKDVEANIRIVISKETGIGVSSIEVVRFDKK